MHCRCGHSVFQTSTNTSSFRGSSTEQDKVHRKHQKGIGSGDGRTVLSSPPHFTTSPRCFLFGQGGPPARILPPWLLAAELINPFTTDHAAARPIKRPFLTASPLKRVIPARHLSHPLPCILPFSFFFLPPSSSFILSLPRVAFLLYSF